MFEEDIDVAEDLLETFLIRATSHFKNCVKPIKSNMNVIDKCYDVNLDIDEINILSDLMVLSWLDWNNNNIIQMNFSLTDNDYFNSPICIERYVLKLLEMLETP